MTNTQTRRTVQAAPPKFPQVQPSRADSQGPPRAPVRTALETTYRETQRLNVRLSYILGQLDRTSQTLSATESKAEETQMPGFNELPFAVNEQLSYVFNQLEELNDRLFGTN